LYANRFARERQDTMKAHRLLTAIFWIAYLLAMVASISHVAWAFNTLEASGPFQLFGWLAAIAVDTGLAALAYAIQQRRQAGRGVRSLWLGVLLFAGISGYANLAHALNWHERTLLHAFLLSATLPLLVLYLGDIVSSDDVATIAALEAERERQKREAEKQKAIEERKHGELAQEKQRRSEAEANALALKAELSALKAELAALEANQVAEKPFKCEHCPATFETQAALNGHKKLHRNGHNLEAALSGTESERKP
jgi:hypothetical protein